MLFSFPLRKEIFFFPLKTEMIEEEEEGVV